MIYSYYPGCTLKTQGKDLDIFGRRSLEALGVQIEEVADWQCCGGVYPMAKDEIATKLSSVRTLNQAKELGRPLMTLCSACHHVLTRVNNDMKTDMNTRTKANDYCKFDEPYNGETEVIHFLQLLRDVVGFDNLKAKVVNPLKGRKIGAYYGCLLLRPSAELAFDDPENPTIIEDFIKAIGATPVLYPFRNECCGGYIAITDKAQATKNVDKIIDSANYNGCDELVTACPLCMYNVSGNAGEGKEITIKYFTELLAEALGVK